MIIESRRANNTGLLGPFPGGTPMSQLRAGGLAGLGEADAGTGTTGLNLSDPATVTAINSELVFLTNLARQAAGMAPLAPQSSAPSVNVGLTSETQTLLIGGLVLGAFFFMKKKPARAARRRR